MKTYTYVATVQSFTEPDKMYTLKRDEQGKLSCSCPAWIFNHSGDRTCKHIHYYLKHVDNKSRFELIDINDVKVQDKVQKIRAKTPKNVKVEANRYSLLIMED